MEPLSLEAFDAEAAAFDQRIARVAGIDHFCSSTDWVVPAAQGLMPAREPWLRRGHSGYVALMRSRHPSGAALLEPLEAMWGLACPLAGDDPDALAMELFGELRREPVSWDMALLCGLSMGSPLFEALVRAFSGHYRLGLGPSTQRYCADLRDGADAFLRRRSANLRLNLKRARRSAEAEGIRFLPCGGDEQKDAPALYERILAVEARSWKGREGSGLLGPDMQSFYRRMLPRLVARGAVRLLFAQKDGRDVAYILGAVSGDGYRGLQFSYDDAYERCSLGNLAQYEQILRLCDEGVASYDLGTDVEYKRRWAEPGLETVTMIIAR